jgi:hypothetical protein
MRGGVKMAWRRGGNVTLKKPQKTSAVCGWHAREEGEKKAKYRRLAAHHRRRLKPAETR